MSAVKQKHIVVTTEPKINATERLDKGESVKLISDELGADITMLNDCMKIKKSIQDYYTQSESKKTFQHAAC